MNFLISYFDVSGDLVASAPFQAKSEQRAIDHGTMMAGTMDRIQRLSVINSHTGDETVVLLSDQNK